MKSLLGCLMCLVFTASQTFAISGGPWSGGGQVAVVGTYAGVLVPLVVVVDPGPPPVTLPPDDSLVLFTLKIPRTGLGIGDAVVFRNGIFYSGQIQASADPDGGRLSGVINAQFQQIISSGSSSTGSSESIQSYYEANGKFRKTSIVTRSSSSGTSRIIGRGSLT